MNTHVQGRCPMLMGVVYLVNCQGLEVTYIVDNGASYTIVNPQVYKRIPEDVLDKAVLGRADDKGAWR